MPNERYSHRFLADLQLPVLIAPLYSLFLDLPLPKQNLPLNLSTASVMVSTLAYAHELCACWLPVHDPSLLLITLLLTLLPNPLFMTLALFLTTPLQSCPASLTCLFALGATQVRDRSFLGCCSYYRSSNWKGLQR